MMRVRASSRDSRWGMSTFTLGMRFYCSIGRPCGRNPRAGGDSSRQPPAAENAEGIEASERRQVETRCAERIFAACEEVRR